MFDDGVGLGIGRNDAGVRHNLHQVDDLVPAGLVEFELQRVARGVTTGALVREHLLDAGVLWGLVGQCRNEQFTRQLSNLPFEVGHRLQHEILVLRRGEVDRALGGLEAERLRPDAVLAGGQGRKIVVAGFVGVDAGRDGRAVLLGRHRHAGELLARRRGDRAGQHHVGGRSPRCSKPGYDQAGRTR